MLVSILSIQTYNSGPSFVFYPWSLKCQYRPNISMFCGERETETFIFMQSVYLQVYISQSIALKLHFWVSMQVFGVGVGLTGMGENRGWVWASCSINISIFFRLVVLTSQRTPSTKRLLCLYSFDRKHLHVFYTHTHTHTHTHVTSWQVEGEVVRDFIFLGSKITTDGDCSHEIRR